jgi:hypothetical protein
MTICISLSEIEPWILQERHLQALEIQQVWIHGTLLLLDTVMEISHDRPSFWFL